MKNSPKLISLPKMLDDRGNLSFIEQLNHIPFEIKRTYWIYDVPGGEIRGGHSYIENQELVIALSGSFTVVVNDGFETSEFTLNRSYVGLYIPNGIWRHMENFSTNSCALVLSSTIYDVDDYERNMDNFIKSKA
ncbi:MAG: WxcM-like domain-containing protein [Pedobacter sp.]|nr:MAG: WxcM-like domain-containing protein [Pedobacter sp.]